MTMTRHHKIEIIQDDLFLSRVRTPSPSISYCHKKSMTCGFCSGLSNLLFGSNSPKKQAITFIMDKNTVLVWDGILETRNVNADNTGYEVHWHGVVVANDNASDATKVPEPPRNAFKEFVDSDLQFHVEGIATPVDDNMKDDNKFKEYVVSLKGGEGWDYNGAKVHDAEHDVHVTSLLWRGSPDQRNSIVVATGKTDKHGHFVSVGWMRPGNRVTLARRYVRDDDPRATWSNETLRRSIVAQIYNDEDDTIVMPPWKCHALSA